jgi:hypothetical protein
VIPFWEAQGVTKRFKGKQNQNSSQMNPKEIEWLRQPPYNPKCYRHSIRSKGIKRVSLNIGLKNLTYNFQRLVFWSVKKA